ncbi:hypothetical protein K440DRAFT_672073 [Wilcoxina mikolae CBS 423.85]|nr:hypothetical protein K440DRAFT_672073 [Wilcoxina mikolae CBS 423.85]
MASPTGFNIDTTKSVIDVANDIVLPSGPPPPRRQYTDAEWQAAINKKVAFQEARNQYLPQPDKIIRTAKFAFVIRRDKVILPPGMVEVRVFVGQGRSHIVQMHESETRGLRRVKEVRASSLPGRAKIIRMRRPARKCSESLCGDSDVEKNAFAKAVDGMEIQAMA